MLRRLLNIILFLLALALFLFVGNVITSNRINTFTQKYLLISKTDSISFTVRSLDEAFDGARKPASLVFLTTINGEKLSIRVNPISFQGPKVTLSNVVRVNTEIYKKMNNDTLYVLKDNQWYLFRLK